MIAAYAARKPCLRDVLFRALPAARGRYRVAPATTGARVPRSRLCALRAHVRPPTGEHAVLFSALRPAGCDRRVQAAVPREGARGVTVANPLLIHGL
jgi:hypothetical protein